MPTTRQCRIAARVGRKCPRRCTRITASQSSSESFATVRSRRIPALFTSASSRPNRSTRRRDERVGDGRRRRRRRPTATACPPVAVISATTASPASGSNSATTTAAPCSAHSSASPRPMPRPAPVTTTTFPSRSPMVTDPKERRRRRRAPTTIGSVSDETKFHAMLRDQIRNEFTASQQYTAVAVYLDDEDLPQLAAHFYAQALEERNHAMSMVQYLLDSDLPRGDPGRRRRAQRLHRRRGRRASSRWPRRSRSPSRSRALARTARDEGDYLGEQFMQWFLKEQVEEVASMSTLLTVVRRAGDNLFHIEDFVARELPRARPVDNTGRRRWRADGSRGGYRSVICLPASTSRARCSATVSGSSSSPASASSSRAANAAAGSAHSDECISRSRSHTGTSSPWARNEPGVAAVAGQLQLTPLGQPGQRAHQPVLRLRAHPAQVGLRAGVHPVGGAHAGCVDALGRQDHRVRPLQGGVLLGVRLAVGEPPGEVRVQRHVERGVGVEHVLQALRRPLPRPDDRQRRARLGRAPPRPAPRPGPRTGRRTGSGSACRAAARRRRARVPRTRRAARTPASPASGAGDAQRAAAPSPTAGTRASRSGPARRPGPRTAG